MKTDKNNEKWVTFDEAVEQMGGGIRSEYLHDLCVRKDFPIKKGYRGKPDLVKQSTVDYIKTLIREARGF